MAEEASEPSSSDTAAPGTGSTSSIGAGVAAPHSLAFLALGWHGETESQLYQHEFLESASDPFARKLYMARSRGSL